MAIKNYERESYLYVIRDSEGKRKLGFSKNPDVRVKQLQTGNSLELTVEYRLPIRVRNRAERNLHSLFPADRVRGEWFKIPEESKELLLLQKVFGIVEINKREEDLLKSLGLR